MSDTDNQAAPHAHPLESALGIEAGSTMEALEAFAKGNVEAQKPDLPTTVDPTTGELVERKLEVTAEELELEDRYDDLKVDKQLDVLHSKAIDAFDSQYRLSQEVDPKYSARNAEVAAQYLNIALNAVNSRVDSKYKRQKIRIEKGNAGKPNSVQNNVIVADRNEMLRALFDGKDTKLVGESDAGN